MGAAASRLPAASAPAWGRERPCWGESRALVSPLGGTRGCRGTQACLLRLPFRAGEAGWARRSLSLTLGPLGVRTRAAASAGPALQGAHAVAAAVHGPWEWVLPEAAAAVARQRVFLCTDLEGPT